MDTIDRQRAQRRRARRLGVLAVGLLSAASCTTFLGTQERVSEALVGRPVSLLRGCVGSPEIDALGEVERQRYTWVLQEYDEPFARDRPFGVPRGFPSPLDREEGTCTLEVEARDGKIERTEISGRVRVENDLTTRCAAVLLRCLE